MLTNPLLDPETLKEADFLVWTQDPVTQVFFQSLRARRELTKEAWAQGVTMRATLEETALENHRAQAGLVVLESLIDINLEDIKEVFRNVNDPG